MKTSAPGKSGCLATDNAPATTPQPDVGAAPSPIGKRAYPQTIREQLAWLPGDGEVQQPGGCR